MRHEPTPRRIDRDEDRRTDTVVADSLPTKDPEPVRRGRHLALCICGAVAAFFAGIGDRLRSFVRGRRAVLAVAATPVLVAGSAAAYCANTGQAAPRPLAEPGTLLTLPGTDSNAQGPEPSTPAEHRTRTSRPTQRPEGMTAPPSGAHLTLPGPADVTEDDHKDDSGHDGQDRPGTGTPGEPSAPAPTHPGGTKPPTPSPAPPAPSEPPHTTPPLSDGREICTLPDLINLCASMVGARP